MEDSTYETFEGELVTGTPLQERPPAKSVKQIRRTDMQATRKVKEELPSPQTIPKTAQREISRTTLAHRALSIQNLRQMEAPWEGVITLNRCLFVAIAILLISSGIHRLHEALKALQADGDGETAEDSLVPSHGGLRSGRTPPQSESSLLDSLFWWMLEDDDDDEDEDEEEQGVAGRTEAGTKSARGRAKGRETPGSAGRKREKRREKQGRGREEEEEEEEEGGERVMGKRGREKRGMKQQAEEEGPRKRQRKSEKQEKQKRSEVTELAD